MPDAESVAGIRQDVRTSVAERMTAAGKNRQQFDIDGLPHSPERVTELDQMCLAVFSTAQGQRLLVYLEGITLRNVLGPNTTSEQLHYREGSRFIVSMLRARATRAGKDKSDA